MKQLFSVLTAVVLVFTLSVPALADVDFTGQVSTTIQALESEAIPVEASSLQSNNEEIGFGDALFNLQVHGDVAQGVTGFAEVQNNAWEPLDTDVFERDPNDIDLREAYLTFHDLFSHAYLRVGRVDLKYGSQYMDRSVNARVQDNPLIGNHLNDFGGPETGLHTGGEFPLQPANLGIDWYAAMTNGTREATVNEGQGLAFTGSLGFDVFSAGYLKGSYHRVSHDEDLITSFDEQSQFAVAEGESYLLQDDLRTSVVGFSPDLRAWQVDGRYDIRDLGLVLSAYLGRLNEEDSDSEIDYWNAQADWMVTPRFGVAGRYGENEQEEPEINFERAQVGFSYQYRENTLAKLEYVDQDVSFDGETVFAFDGLIGELSIDF